MKITDLDQDFFLRLREVVFFIVTNYAVMWFEWKCLPNFIETPKHVFKQIQLLQHLPPTTIDIAKNYLKSWYAHPEY